MSLLAGPRTAVGFLTRIPVRDTAPLTTERFSRAALWFPVVGLLVGAVAGGTRLLGDAAGLPPGPATVLALLAAVLVTGGLHEDGLADTADALGAHTTRERKLEILRDSRVGTFGALAVAYALLFAYASLAGLDGEDVLRAALVGHALGRWSGLPQSLLLPEAEAAPMVAYLAHEDCPVSGEAYTAGGGRFARLFIGSTEGVVQGSPTIEDVAAHWAEINDETGYFVPDDLMDWSMRFLAHRLGR